MSENIYIIEVESENEESHIIQINKKNGMIPFVKRGLSLDALELLMVNPPVKNSKRHDITKEKIKNKEGKVLLKYVFEEGIYQMFSTNCNGGIYNYIAESFKQNNVLPKLRLFEDLPNKEQLKQIKEETKNDWCIIPLAFKKHFATGLCFNGEFYIFDSTRQLSEEEHNTKEKVNVNGYEFAVLNNDKKYQSELTGTCGYWTMFMSTELADNFSSKSNKDIEKNMSLKTYNPKIEQSILEKVSKKVISVTKEVIQDNKYRLLSLSNLSIKFEKIEQEVKNVSSGINYNKKNSKVNYEEFCPIRKEEKNNFYRS